MIVSTGIFDSERLQIVSVIASFDVKGNVQPLYVRIESESLKILDAIKASASTRKLYIYDCHVQDGEFVKSIKITYHVEHCAWSMNKVSKS